MNADQVNVIAGRLFKETLYITLNRPSHPKPIRVRVHGIQWHTGTPKIQVRLPGGNLYCADIEHCQED